MNKLKRRLYDNPEEVISDIKLIFENCRLYNDENSEIRRVSFIFSSNFKNSRGKCIDLETNL